MFAMIRPYKLPAFCVFSILLFSSLAHPGFASSGLEKEFRKASFQRDVSKMKQLLQKGVDPNSIVDSVLQWNALHLAAYFGDLQVVHLLIENGAGLEARTKTKQTPLYMASEQGQLETVRLLLKKGADVNAKSRLGRTALYMALANGKKDVGDLLLEYGADVNATTEDGWTALMRA